jgi:hypothetical protein
LAETHIVYGLFDPRTGELRYVGRTSVGASRRLSAHLTAAKRKGRRTRVANWVRSLLDVGETPTMDTLEEFCSFPECSLGETFYVCYFRYIGCDLVNLTDGGEGVQGSNCRWKGQKLPLSWAANAAKARIGCTHSAATRQKRSKSLAGHLVTEQAKTLMSLNHSRKRPVLCVETGQTYPSVKAASLSLGLHAPAIRLVAKGVQKQTGGYTFKYIERVLCS